MPEQLHLGAEDLVESILNRKAEQIEVSRHAYMMEKVIDGEVCLVPKPIRRENRRTMTQEEAGRLLLDDCIDLMGDSDD